MVPSTPADASSTVTRHAPPVVQGPAPIRNQRPRSSISTTSGWTPQLAEPRFADLRRRIPTHTPPTPSGDRLQVGEQFRFDLSFGGNPAGLAEARVAAIEPDPRGPAPLGAPQVRIEGSARTSGIVSLLATVTDDIVTYVDAQSGATIRSVSEIRFSGWSATKYRHRVTEQTYDGRGYVRIVDTKDNKAKRKQRHIPLDTFDPLSGMAWIRSLALENGDTARVHIIDGTTLLRVDLESRGFQPIPDMPSIGHALGIDPNATLALEGTLTRVDAFDQPIQGKRVYRFQAWMSGDDRRIPLAIESDMWVGALRMALTGYDPPHDRSASGQSATGRVSPNTDAIN